MPTGIVGVFVLIHGSRRAKKKKKTFFFRRSNANGEVGGWEIGNEATTGLDL